MAIFSLLSSMKGKKWIHVSKDLDPKSWVGRSRYVYESDFDVVENMSIEEYDKWFNNYCNWCWGHGYGNCSMCKKHYKQFRLAKIMNDKYKAHTGKNVWE